jgi:hypothetical protein
MHLKQGKCFMLVPWEVLLFLVAVHLPSTVFIFVLADEIKESVCTAIYLHAVSRSRNTAGESAFIPQTSFNQFSPFLLLWVSAKFIFLQIQVQGSRQKTHLTHSST